MSKLFLGLAFLGLLSCGTTDNLAPVVESDWNPLDLNASKYIVRKGDTLYSIAFRYDSDYKELAKYNHLQDPYTLSVGQVIQLKALNVQIKRVTLRPKLVEATYQPAKHIDNHWVWPAKGKISANFVPSRGNKGINIVGKKGDKIYASSSGIVAYSGQGLANYGNLIIIKHNDDYLTAYGNNAINIVKEGQFVKSGQVIAEMGIIDRKYYGLHFEIRKKGQPVNPSNYF